MSSSTEAPPAHDACALLTKFLAENSLKDSVEKVEILIYLTTESITIINKCVEHFEQFPTSPLPDVQQHYDILKRYWLVNWGALNEEVNKADRFSISDLLFVSLCYMELALQPSWRVCAEADQQIDQVLEMVRYVGCQHTPGTMHAWVEPAFLQQLKQNVAWVVVMKLSSTMTGFAEAEQRKEELIRQKKWVHKLDALTWVPPDIYAKLAAMKAYAEPPRNAEGKFIREMQWGEYFSQSSCSGVLLKVCSRVINGIELENHLLSLYPIDGSSDLPTFTDPEVRTQMKTWLHRACMVDSSDDFSQDFRTAVFDACLPINSCADAHTRTGGGGTAKVIPLTQLQNEMGYEIASEISNSFGMRVRSIGYDPTHPFYDFIMLYMFGYACFHEIRLNFVETLYISQTKLHENLRLIQTKLRFGRIRDPLIVRLQRKFYIHYIHSDTHEARWMPCENATDACLFWISILKKHNESELLSGHRMGDWIDKFLSVRDFDLEEKN